MKECVKVFMLCTLLCGSLKAQVNLVPNPSFEDTMSCPQGPTEIACAAGWSGNGSSDYMNACAPTNSASVPYNWGGYQQPFSGNAYAAIITYYSLSTNYREFITHSLSAPLVVGTKYYISFMVNLSIGGAENANCASNKIGAMFSVNGYSGFYQLITNAPPVYSSSILSDTASWVRVFGSFTADSAYNHIILGNFFDDANTDTTIFSSSPWDHTYYFIDDVCVSTDSLYTLNYVHTGINQHDISDVDCFPNPTTDFVNIHHTSGGPITVVLFDATGQTVFVERDVLQPNLVLDLRIYSNGMYFLHVVSDTRIEQVVIIKQ